MSNVFTACVRLTQDPEELTLGEREVVKLRLADNTFGKNTLARFFDALVAGPDLEAARQLKAKDQIVISGQLVKTSYKSKKGKMKGKVVESDSMPFAKIIQITNSPSFFGGGDDEDEAPEQTEEPDLDAPADAGDGTSPLDDLV